MPYVIEAHCGFELPQSKHLCGHADVRLASQLAAGPRGQRECAHRIGVLLLKSVEDLFRVRVHPARRSQSTAPVNGTGLASFCARALPPSQNASFHTSPPRRAAGGSSCVLLCARSRRAPFGGHALFPFCVCFWERGRGKSLTGWQKGKGEREGTPPHQAPVDHSVPGGLLSCPPLPLMLATDG